VVLVSSGVSDLSGWWQTISRCLSNLVELLVRGVELLLALLDVPLQLVCLTYMLSYQVSKTLLLPVMPLPVFFYLY
jgi:hypothetical protein